MRMRIILSFLSLVAYCTAGEQVFLGQDERSISGSVVAAIEAIREQMPCGFPEQGIPPLAPLTLSHETVMLNRTDIKVHGTVFDFALNGLNDFVIDEFKVNILSSKVTFRLVFNDINMATMYDLKAELNKFGFTVKLQGEGSAKYAVRNLVIWGSMKYSLNLVSGNMKVKSMEVRINVGDAESEIEGILGNGIFNEKMNEILAELVPQLVNENEETITKTIETVGLPIINKQLENMSINDLIGGGESSEKPKCNPNDFN